MISKRKLDDFEDYKDGNDKDEEVINPDTISYDSTLNTNKKALRLFKGSKNNNKRLIVVLENANLELVKNNDTFSLLNCDDHIDIIHKNKKDPAFCRPDILHQCLLMLLDSPLNRAGLLQIYVHTNQNVLIEVNPQLRIPRTFKRFSSIMVQLIQRFTVKAVGSSTPLLKIIKNPINSHLPFCKKVLMSFNCKNLIKPVEIVPKEDTPIVLIIGAMAHGKIEVDYADEEASISQYPLSAALTCTKVCSSFEEIWGIH